MSRADEPAYPTQPHVACDNVRAGMTLREAFAMAAMQGSLAGAPGRHLQPPTLYIEAVQHADGLIAELAKPVKP